MPPLNRGHERPALQILRSIPLGVCCLVYLLRCAPRERIFVTALLHQHTVAEISKISNVTEGAAAPNAQAQ